MNVRSRDALICRSTFRFRSIPIRQQLPHTQPADKSTTKIPFIESGNISAPYRCALVVVGGLLTVLPTTYMQASWLWLLLLMLGLVVMAVGGFAARAHTLNLKPFDSSCERARKTYESGSEDKTPCQ